MVLSLQSPYRKASAQSLVYLTMCSIVAVGFIVVACVGSYNAHNQNHLQAAPLHTEVVEIAESIEYVELAPEVEYAPVYVKSDMQVIAEAVMGESGGEPLVGKVAVAATILNKMEYYNITVYEALEAYDAYPYYGVVTNECYRAVEIAMENRDLFPRDMMYFRTEHYHNFGVPYVQIGNHYFSTKE